MPRSPTVSSTPRGSLSGAGRPRSPAPAPGLATRPKLSSASPLARDNSETSLGASGAASKIRAQKVTQHCEIFAKPRLKLYS